MYFVWKNANTVLNTISGYSESTTTGPNAGEYITTLTVIPSVLTTFANTETLTCYAYLDAVETRSTSVIEVVTATKLSYGMFWNYFSGHPYL